MANYVRMSDSEIRKLQQDARAIPKPQWKVPRTDLVELLQVCAQWHMPLKRVLALLDPKTVQREKQWRQNRNSHPYKIRMRRPPQWAEITVAAATGDVLMPDEWLAPQVEDPAGSETFRNQYYRENYTLIERDSRWFIPACNGNEYFSDEQITTIDALALPEILGWYSKEELPVEPEPV